MGIVLQISLLHSIKMNSILFVTDRTHSCEFLWRRPELIKRLPEGDDNISVAHLAQLYDYGGTYNKLFFIQDRNEVRIVNSVTQESIKCVNHNGEVSLLNEEHFLKLLSITSHFRDDFYYNWCGIDSLLVRSKEYSHPHDKIDCTYTTDSDDKDSLVKMALKLAEDFESFVIPLYVGNLLVQTREGIFLVSQRSGNFEYEFNDEERGGKFEKGELLPLSDSSLDFLVKYNIIVSDRFRTFEELKFCHD